MIHVPLIDELRETRRRLAELCREDPHVYARMLQEVAQRLPGTYVTTPLTPGRHGAEHPASACQSA